MLLVDDSPLVRALLKERLVGAGYEVHLAINGEEALASIADQRPDIILSDLRMPVLDGYELLRRVRKRDASQVFIVLTSDRRATAIVRALGASDVVVKSAVDDDILVALGRFAKAAGRR